MRNTAKAGYASVLTMLLLVLGFTLCAWLYSAVANGTSVTRNELTSARAMAAAESGLASTMYQLREVSRTTGFKRTSNDPAILEKDTLAKVCEVMQARSSQQLADSSLHLIAGTVTSDLVAPKFTISPVTLADGSTYSAEMTLSKKYAHGYTVQVTGQSGGAKRTVCLDLSPEIVFGSASMDYAIATKGTLGLPNGSGSEAGIYKYDPNADPPFTNDLAEAQNMTSDGPGFLLFDDSPAPQDDVLFPDVYLPDDVYSALKAMVTSGDLSTVSGQTVTDTSNIYIPPSDKNNPQAVTFPPDSVIQGIIYVGWPNKLVFDDTVRIEGIIVYEKPATLPAENQSSPSQIVLGRAAAVTSNMGAAAQYVAAALNNAKAPLTDAQKDLMEYAFDTWAVHAPQTDFVLENGDTTDETTRTLEGNFHIRRLVGAGRGDTSKSNLVIKGQIMCEGDVDLSGNRVFCIQPPDPADNPDADRRLRLNVSRGGYWELME